MIFRSLGGEPIDDNYETEACGIPQLETVDLETLSLFKSRTDLACLRDLLNAKCFIGKAHNVVCVFRGTQREILRKRPKNNNKA